MKRIESFPARALRTATSREKRVAVGFEELAIPFLDSAYNLARWLARNDHEAEDLVQETYLKALRSFHSFRAGTNFRAWMFRILRNTFLSSVTSPTKVLGTPLESEEEWIDLAVECDTPETILLSQVESELVHRAIDNLPIHYREAILLCEMEGMSYREIAEILSVPVGTVMSRLARARRFIREFMLGTRVSGAQSEPDRRPVFETA